MSTMPTGTLMKNTQRQPGPSVSRPLAITPTEAAPPPMAPKMPSARFRSCPSGKVTARIDRAAGATRAAPNPWTPRAVMSTADDWAMPRRTSGREGGQPGQEDPSSPEQVGHPAPEEQEPAEQEPVGDDHPLQRALADVEVLLDGRQGHVHDRDVEHDHELRGARQGQDHAGVESVMSWCP